MPKLIGILVAVGLVCAYWKFFLIVLVLGGVGYGLFSYIKSQRQQPPPAPHPILCAAKTAPAVKVLPVKLTSTRASKAFNMFEQSSNDISDDADTYGADADSAVWSPTLPYANLMRRSTGWAVKDVIYTAVDLETTGLDGTTDRIVEIGLVKFTADGTIIDEFATLVNNPGSSSGARLTHQIDDAELVGAPTTGDALREAFAFMAGTVVVAHNWEFEERFLISEARRCGLALPDILAVCTMKTAQRQMDGRGYSLKIMYKSATGQFLNDAHAALADARAVREVLLWLLRNAPKPLHLTAAPPKPSFPPYSGGSCSIKCRPAPMGRASMSALIDAFPQSPNPRMGDPAEVEKYRALLAEYVEDGRLTYEETCALREQAQRSRLTGSQLRDLHLQAWWLTFPDPDNWVALDPTGRRERYLLADALGLEDLGNEIHTVIEAQAEPAPDPAGRYLRGLRIGIAGDTAELMALRTRAEGYGAKIAVNITKTVQWMVSVTPDASDSRHSSARRFGVPIVTPAEGGKRLEEAVRAAELKAFERQREIDEMEALRQSYRDEQDAYWRPVWRSKELDQDPEREYYWR